MSLPVIAILGAGDLGTACALRLFRSGFKVILIEKTAPQDIHYIRNFIGAVYSGKKEINGIKAKTVSGFLQQESLAVDNFEESFLPYMLNNNEIPILTENDTNSITSVKIAYLVIAQAELKKIPAIEVLLNDEVKTIGFDTDAVDIESYIIGSNGLVFYPFLRDEYDTDSAGKQIKKPDTIKAPIEGVFMADKEINSTIHLKNEVGKISNIPILSPYEGKLSGRLNSGAFVKAGTSIAEITPLNNEDNDGRKIPDKYNLLSGAVLEAVMFDMNLQKNENS